MFSSRKAICDSTDIPSAWLFEHYLRLGTKLTGQNHRLNSIFNPRDANPSMFIYLKNGEYRFKCFSTGKEGNGFDLLQFLYKCDFPTAFSIAKNDYINNGVQGALDKIVPEPRWTLSNYAVKDKWDKLDALYWREYNIGSKILEHFNVRPLRSYSMIKDESSFTVSKARIYGYFTAAGELYKIYNPESEHRFINIKNVIQGWDQISSDTSRLFICSSLKDIMSLYSLNIKGNIIAPPSENAKIDVVKDWVDLHKHKYTIFDNDPAGINAMHTYETTYGIPYILLPLSKDISDSVKDHGARKVKIVLTSML